MLPYENPARSARVERERLKFAAAHMATFAGAMEPLHGHNYSLIIEATGELDAEGWIVDFGTLKRIGRDVCDRLDHHFLLQGRSTLLGMQRLEDAWELTFGEKRYRFPLGDVFELPVENTTAEQIAEWIWGQLLQPMRQHGLRTVQRLTVGVEEAPGQAGWFGADVPK